MFVSELFFSRTDPQVALRLPTLAFPSFTQSFTILMTCSMTYLGSELNPGSSAMLLTLMPAAQGAEVPMWAHGGRMAAACRLVKHPPPLPSTLPHARVAHGLVSRAARDVSEKVHQGEPFQGCPLCQQTRRGSLKDLGSKTPQTGCCCLVSPGP